MFRISRVKFSMVMAAIMAFASFGLASAQNPAYTTPLVTSVTYQNVGTAEATVSFKFYNQKNGTPIDISRTLPAGAGDSLFVGQLQPTDPQLPEGFLGSAVLSSNQPIVATAVQIASTSTTVKNRPLSNGFSSGASTVLLATVLKNKFNTTSTFSVQNADSEAIDITVRIFDADNTSAPAIVLSETNIPVGAAKTYDMGTISQISASVFNGSATVSAVKSSDKTTAASIVASVLEFSTNAYAVKAFEGVNSGAQKIYMATALCDAFNPKQRTAYAVQNTSTTATANVVVKYSNNVQETAAIGPGAKRSFNACTAPSAITNFTGAATIESTGADIIVIGKAFFADGSPAGFETAFLGESQGDNKLALPYVRYASDAKYASGSRQRTNIAIQNIGTTPVSNVQVKYLNKNGTVVGTHTIASIEPGAKANSKPTDAGSSNELLEFGSPDSNPGGGFGGAAVIEAPAGSQLIAIGRVSSSISGNLVAEDYNAIPID